VTGSYRTLIPKLIGLLTGLIVSFTFVVAQTGAVLYHIPPEEASAKEDLNISVGLLQDMSVSDVTLFFRKANTNSYHERQMEYRGGVWYAIIEASELATEGLEYLIVLRTLNGGYYASPDNSPFESPHFVPVKTKISQGRHFLDSDKLAKVKTIDADILILSPQSGELLAPDEVVIALSLFNAPPIDTASIRIEIDGIDYTAQAELSSEIISLYPDEIEPGLHTIRAYMSTIYGMQIKPVVWSFATSTGYINVDEQLAYSGEIISRLSSDRIESQVLNVAEITAKSEVGLSWVKAKTNFRLTNRESPYLQPMNRYNTEINIGDYLTVNAGDFFPSHSSFVLDGKRVRGIGVDLHLRWFRFQYANGTINRAVQHQDQVNEGYYLKEVRRDSLGNRIYVLDRTGYTFTRKMSAYRLSVDFLSRYHIGLSILKSKDIINSVDKLISGGTFSIDSTNSGAVAAVPYQTYTYKGFSSALAAAGAQMEFSDLNWGGNSPEENILAGFEYSSVHDEQRLRIDANWYISMQNRNIWEGTMSRTEMDTALDDSLDGLIGVQYDEYGLATSSSLMIDTTKIPDPTKYSDFFTININMVPLLPFDYLAYQEHPLSSIINMPSTAYNFRVRGYYFNNNLSAEYRQIGPEYHSFGNPYMMNNTREIILSDRVLLMDNKLLFNGSYKYQSNKILKTAVDPYRTSTLLANITLAPGPEVPSFTMNFQSITKNNTADGLNSLVTDGLDQRENTLTRNSLMSINFPFNMGMMKNNLVINRYQVNNFDLVEDRADDDSTFNATDSRSIALNLTSHFTDIPLKTTLSFNQTNLITAYADFTWTVIGIQGSYSILDERARISGIFNYLNSSGSTLIKVFNTQVGGEYNIKKNLVLNGMLHIQFSHTPEWKDDGLDNDGNGKSDEFLETLKLNSSTFNLTINYRF